jgi:hypothetical protein
LEHHGAHPEVAVLQGAVAMLGLYVCEPGRSVGVGGLVPNPVWFGGYRPAPQEFAWHTAAVLRHSWEQAIQAGTAAAGGDAPAPAAVAPPPAIPAAEAPEELLALPPDDRALAVRWWRGEPGKTIAQALSYSPQIVYNRIATPRAVLATRHGRARRPPPPPPPALTRRAPPGLARASREIPRG